jgi:sugar phosphate isomerase/epimerase
MISRRSVLCGIAALPLAAARPERRFAICSETFTGMDFASACRAAAKIGYEGIEIEPAHLGPDPAALTPDDRKRIRQMMREFGLACVGLHSFLKAPAGLHLTTSDEAIRKRSWNYFARLIDLAADLTDRPVMVFGSSKQRQAIDGVTPQLAKQRLIDGLKTLSPLAASRQVTILMEPLAPHLCNVVNTLDEAVQVVRAVDSLWVDTMFDCHNTAGEKKPIADLVREHLPHIRHVHLNEMDGRRPGAGNFPFGELLETLQKLDYRGWLSVEVFDFKPDGETVAKAALNHLQSLA